MIRVIVRFTNGQRIYNPGQTVTGQVSLVLARSIRARSVSLTFSGLAFAMVDFNSKKELCLNHNTTLWTAPPGQVTLPVGSHHYNFSFQLPDRLPASFEFGSPSRSFIRYCLVVKVHRPRRFAFKHQAAFVILERININDAALLCSMRSENEKQRGCYCCTSGPLALSATVDRMGYCPGETIIVSAVAENHSDRQLSGMRIRLICLISLLPNSRCVKRYEITLRQIITGRVIPPGERHPWPNVTMDVPPLPETVNTCSVLARDYYVEVAILVPKGRNLRTYFPIIIGSVPLHPSSRITGYVAIDSRGGQRPRQPVPQSAYMSTQVTAPRQITPPIHPTLEVRHNESPTPRHPRPPLPRPYIPPPDPPRDDDNRENVPLLTLTTEV